ncbi:MAG: cold shock domain-containing protein [Bacilli bacterium]
MAKSSGKVKKFNKDKGYGFILGDDGKDYFFYYTSLNMDGFKTVDVDAKVEFTAQESERGLRAIDIDIAK